MNIIRNISSNLKISAPQVSAAIDLFSKGNTIPFVARYRKEATGELDEEQLRSISDLFGKLQSLEQRRASILKSLSDQGYQDLELLESIRKAQSLTELEDIYLPYRPKRRTRATVAKEMGLEPLAKIILKQSRDIRSITDLASRFLGEEVLSVDEAFNGARDILAEWISENPNVRHVLRSKAQEWATIKVERNPSAVDERGQFELYYDFEQKIKRLRPHQILAFNRGEREKILRVRVEIPERDWRYAIETEYKIDPGSLLAEQLSLAIEDTSSRLLLPAIERDLRRWLTDSAEGHAINVFAENLKALLYQPPMSGYTVLGVDPGFRTGCKLAVVNLSGDVLATETIYPHAPQNNKKESLNILQSLIVKYRVDLFAIGNGTASRETETLIASLISSVISSQNLHYIIVSEAGASVYSASPLAREELPDLDVSMRGAVSIARRVQDPLAELVKIDPKAIGVGMYQHDVDQKKLSLSLDSVVESVVNDVGVDINTASSALLRYISGIGVGLAAKIVEFRSNNGLFRSREEIKSVRGMGPKSFEQAAGFLRVRDGLEPLDASAIHPESYAIARKIIHRIGLSLTESMEARKQLIDDFLMKHSMEDLAYEFRVGMPTLRDILQQLVQPQRDPRDDLPKPILRTDVLKIEDLTIGMKVKGTVRNVVDFGAFIDIGVKQDGLLHISQIPKGESLSPGDVLEVQVLRVELERGRIGFGWTQ